MRLQSGGEPFLLRSGDTGCLLVHGFPGTPAEMRWMGEHLHEAGYTVLGIRLFGHATQRSDLLRVHPRDWLANLEDGYAILNGQCSRIFLIGLSFGAVLCATFAQEIDPAGLVLMAMPMDLPRLAHRLRPSLSFLKHVWRYRKRPSGSDWFDPRAEEINLHYDVHPIHAAGHIFDMVMQLRSKLEMIKKPTLLIYSRNDATVPAAHGQWAYDAIASRNKELVYITGSGHNLPRDARCDEVFRHATTFIQSTDQELS
jgi:carboxylesterase